MSGEIGWGLMASPRPARNGQSAAKLRPRSGAVNARSHNRVPSQRSKHSGGFTPSGWVRVFGYACVALHFACLLLNLTIHWGTLIGTMSGIFSFICSIGTVAFARFVFGYIEQGRYYKVGWVKYTREELK